MSPNAVTTFPYPILSPSTLLGAAFLKVFLSTATDAAFSSLSLKSSSALLTSLTSAPSSASWFPALSSEAAAPASFVMSWRGLEGVLRIQQFFNLCFAVEIKNQVVETELINVIYWGAI